MSSSKPSLRFSNFSDELNSATLAEITSKKISYGIVQAGPHVEGGMPYIKSKDLNGPLLIEELERTSEEIAKKYRRSEVNPGDIVFSLRGNIGVSQIVPDSIPVANLTQGTARISCSSKINPVYLINELQTSRVRKRVLALAKGSTFQEISLEELRNVIVNFPSYEEQEQVASFLSTVDKKVRLLKEKHALLEQYKKGVMQKLFKQEIRFKDDGGSEFPDWQWKQGNEVFDAISNKSHNSDLPILAITQEHGAIPRDLINYQVQVTDGSVASYKVVEEGDYIISLRSFQGGIEYSRYKGICSPAYIILRPSISIDDDFYRYYLKTGRFIQEMKRRLEGIRDGKILSYKYFSEIKLPFPCIEEQRKISHFINILDKKLSLVKEQVELTQTFKKGLLQQMFV